jgi:hypothetical protein
MVTDPQNIPLFFLIVAISVYNHQSITSINTYIDSFQTVSSFCYTNLWKFLIFASSHQPYNRL